MNLNKRVNRTFPETIEHTRAFLQGRPLDRSMRRLCRTERACDRHHVIAHDHLRAGTVKARRPRACAVGAKRRALHGAEHRCSIVVVMADGVDVTPNVITPRRPLVDVECSARESRFPGQPTGRQARANVTCLRATFPDERGPDPPEDLSHIRARSMRQNTRRFSPPNMLCPTT
jgi:hypothetical protein